MFDMSLITFFNNVIDSDDGVQIAVGRAGENLKWEALWVAGVIYD